MMMHLLPIPAAGVRGDQLTDELAAVGIDAAVSVGYHDDTEYVEVVADADESAVAPIVAAHRPIVDPGPANRETLEERAVAALAANVAYIAAAKPGTAAAQASAAYDASVQHARQINAVIRLLLGRTDTVD